MNEDWLAFLPHWLQNQYIRNDRYKPSIYHNQLLDMRPDFFNKIPEAPVKQILDKKQTEVLKKDLFNKWYPAGIPSDNQCDTQLRLDKFSSVKSKLDKISIDKISQVEDNSNNYEADRIINEEGIKIINSTYCYDKTNKMLKKLFISMNDKLNKGVPLDDSAYVNKTARNFWIGIAESEKKAFSNVMNMTY